MLATTYPIIKCIKQSVNCDNLTEFNIAIKGLEAAGCKIVDSLWWTHEIFYEDTGEPLYTGMVRGVIDYNIPLPPNYFKFTIIEESCMNCEPPEDIPMVFCMDVVLENGEKVRLSTPEESPMLEWEAFGAIRKLASELGLHNVLSIQLVEVRAANGQ